MARPLATEPAQLDPIDRTLITALQDGLPLIERPYVALADALGISEQAVVDRIAALLERRVLTRFGPMFDVARMGGAFVLAALAVPDERWDVVCEQVNALPEVAHNYRREHALNMWFVLATETPQGIDAAIARIEAETGLPVYAFPKEHEFFVELKFTV
ncbi:Lrp/AsnC family transcriptional regulator [Niveibacterium microcysteis]|uniref:siroheme decarboxylase n=1 Tax=Niveibacterium microcysteis TaxID=2811415 RepID=A0ABX7M741_9RHOO|nr:AsnC family transcriptional regulator [Niveibacterium microcysteis]QSI77572.1 AsnC family transcriptional regulator [Niveibacterium microcysteis]